MTYHIGSVSFNFEDLVVYPAKGDANFERDLETVTKKLKTYEYTKPFKMLPHQEELLRIVNVYSPYRSFLFYHDMGTGKTVTIILCIENLKPFMIEHSTRALVLVPNNMIQNTTYVKELLGKIKHNNKTQYRKWCTGDTYVTERLRDLLNNAVSDNERKKLEKQILKEKIAPFYEITTHKKWETTVQSMSNEEIFRYLSNRPIVVEESQRAKNSNSQFFGTLQRVLKNTVNVYLFEASGTPMVDDPTEICPPINLCRINEGYSELLEPKTVKQFFSTNVQKQELAAAKITELTRGFVSRVVGANTENCPNRIDAGEPICEDDDSVLNVVYSRMHGRQLSEYLHEFMNEFLASNDSDPNEMWNQSRKICRGIWSGSEILSQKFEDIWANSRKAVGKGVIVNYSYFIADGIMPFERFLLSKKETAQFDGSGNPSANKEIVFNFSNPKTDHYKGQVTEIIGNYDNYNGKIVQWVLGTLKIGTGITICMTSQMNLIESPWNLPTSEQFIYRSYRIGTHVFPSYSDMYGKLWNNDITVHRYCARIYEEDFAGLTPMFQKQIARFIETNYERLKERGFLDATTQRLYTIDEYIYRDTFAKNREIAQLATHVTSSAFHFRDLSRERDHNTTTAQSSSLYWLCHLFSENPIWTLNDLLACLPSGFSYETFIETLHRYVEKSIPFKINASNSCTTNSIVGTIKFVPPHHYYVSITNLVIAEPTLPLSHFVEPNINLDDYFPMKIDIVSAVFVPTTFVRDLFEIKADLHLKLKENEYAGVLENTENNPEVFQLKFCTNDTESVCNDKSVVEIYDIAKTVGIKNAASKYGKNRRAICDAIFEQLKGQKRILPWATRSSPTILRAYLIAEAYNAKDLLSVIIDLEENLKRHQSKAFEQMFIDIIALQYPDQYKLHATAISNQVQLRFKKKVEKFPMYLLAVFSQMYTKRPKRFSDKMWEVTRLLRQKIESLYSNDFSKVNKLLFQLVSKQLKQC